MKKFSLLIIFSFILGLYALSFAQVTVTASKTKIPRGQSSVVSIIYHVMPDHGYTPCYITSNYGTFVRGNIILGTNSTPLTINIPSNVNFMQATETLNIPSSVIEKAIKMGFNNFQYVRTFPLQNCFNGPATPSAVTFSITTDAAADFDIKRIELYFENRRAEITVPKNYKGLKAFADLKFTGSGLLKGYWEVDGRILSHVAQHITYGRTVTLQTPEIPPLPTFEPGIHTVKFIITSPSVEIPLPTMLYYVTTQEVREPVKIKLFSPERNAEIEYGSQTFKWESLDNTMLYLIQFFETLDSKPIFSAYTREPFYKVKDFILNKIFQPGKNYYWKVIGFDDKNHTVGESELREFKFINLGFVPGQIIISLSKNDFSEGFIEEMKRKYEVEVLEFFSLESMNSVLVLLKTERNILDKVEQIKRESKIIFAQPNYIFQTFSEPMRKMQYALDLMKINRIHTFFRGRGVKVAVIDTGIDYDHKDLKDRIVYRENFIRGDFYKKEIHGTAVAGLIGASINGFGISGVAPEVNMYSMRACNETGQKSTGICQSLSIVRAMDEAMKNNVNVINMSFGTLNYDRLLASIINKAVESGIFIVAPVSKIGNTITFPASHPEVISVGGIDEKGNPYLSEEISDKAKLLAPAEKLLTTFPHNRHNFISGTSMSSAFVSGLLALYLEKNKNSFQKLPQFKGNICKWEEEIFEMSLCY